MTRKDYVIIAAAIKAARDASMKASLGAVEGVDTAMVKIAKVLKDDNPLFDVARFTAACK